MSACTLTGIPNCLAIGVMNAVVRSFADQNSWGRPCCWSRERKSAEKWGSVFVDFARRCDRQHFAAAGIDNAERIRKIWRLGWFVLNRGGVHKHRQRPRCTGLLALLQPRQRQFILNFARRECRHVGLFAACRNPSDSRRGVAVSRGNRVREWVAPQSTPRQEALLC